MKLGEVTKRWITEIKRVSDIHPINKVSGLLQEEDSEGVKHQKCLSCNRGTVLLWEWTFLKVEGTEKCAVHRRKSRIVWKHQSRSF